MELGIDGIPYAAAQNYGYPPNKLPKREFFKVASDQVMQDMTDAAESQMTEYLNKVKNS
jgi:hypothetical protein